MDEEVVTEAAGIGEALKELDMAAGNGCANGRHRHLVRGGGDRPRIGSVAFKALRAAEPQPAWKMLRFSLENPQHDLFVIAEEKNRPHAVAAIFTQALQ